MDTTMLLIWECFYFFDFLSLVPCLLILVVPSKRKSPWQKVFAFCTKMLFLSISSGDGDNNGNSSILSIQRSLADIYILCVLSNQSNPPAHRVEAKRVQISVWCRLTQNTYAQSQCVIYEGNFLVSLSFSFCLALRPFCLCFGQSCNSKYFFFSMSRPKPKEIIAIHFQFFKRNGRYPL